MAREGRFARAGFERAGRKDRPARVSISGQVPRQGSARTGAEGLTDPERLNRPQGRGPGRQDPALPHRGAAPDARKGKPKGKVSKPHRTQHGRPPPAPLPGQGRAVGAFGIPPSLSGAINHASNPVSIVLLSEAAHTWWVTGARRAMGLQSQASAGPGTVTIITATHNRPDALRLAISSVLNQTHANWRLLVVGDHCDPRTGAVIAAFGDPRIHYVNLPHRCGEQSGPNSVGMALARTPFTAFLNHDDLWFPDHLETGLGRLDEEKADFFAGRAAFLETGAAETDDLVIRDVTPDDRSLAGAFVHTPAYFEPVSTWILRSEACRRVGPWRASTELYRTPLEDWVLPP